MANLNFYVHSKILFQISIWYFQLNIQYWSELHLSKYITSVRGAWEIIMFIHNKMFQERKTKVLSNFRVFCFIPTVT